MFKFNKLKEEVLGSVEKMKVNTDGMLGILEEKTKNLELTKLTQDECKQLVMKHGEKVKEFVVNNKEMLKKEILNSSELKEVFVNKAMILVSVPLITSFLYGLLPAPIRWMLPEAAFSYFVEHHIEFIVETLFIADTASDVVSGAGMSIDIISGII